MRAPLERRREWRASLRPHKTRRGSRVAPGECNEQGRISHCGVFLQLEEEMMALGVAESGGEGAIRLDRADALVWALTALMLAPPRPPLRVFQL